MKQIRLLASACHETFPSFVFLYADNHNNNNNNNNNRIIIYSLHILFEMHINNELIDIISKHKSSWRHIIGSQ